MTNINILNLEFRPRLLPTVATLLVFPILLSLGFWQLHRGEYKKELAEQFADLTHSAPIDYQTVVSDLEKYQLHNIKITGQYINDKSLLLENRFHKHQLGYEVITPLKLPNKKIVLVNRGWVPRPADESLPKITSVNNAQTITGRIIIPKQKIFKLGVFDYDHASWPRLIPNISWESINHAMPGINGSPFIVQLDPKAKNGFIREWTPVTLSPQKHFGYAVQWFAMAATLLLIFITVNTRRKTSDE